MSRDVIGEETNHLKHFVFCKQLYNTYPNRPQKANPLLCEEGNISIKLCCSTDAKLRFTTV